MDREALNVDGAPEAIGPYSQAVRAGGLLFCSGQVPLDPESGELVGDSPAEQATRCLENLKAVCKGSGTSLDNAVRLTIYTTDLAAFPDINEAYAAFFGDSPPARAAVGVSALPKGASVEIDAVVAI